MSAALHPGASPHPGFSPRTGTLARPGTRAGPAVHGWVMLSSVSSDSHTWNLIFLQLLLEEGGFGVHNLGACVPDDLLINRTIAQAPDAVVLSSVNGHGGVDGLRLIRRLRRRPELRRLPVVIGGKLGLYGVANDGVGDELRRNGFTAVFTDRDDPRGLLDILRQQISRPALAAAG